MFVKECSIHGSRATYILLYNKLIMSLFNYAIEVCRLYVMGNTVSQHKFYKGSYKYGCPGLSTTDYSKL